MQNAFSYLLPNPLSRLLRNSRHKVQASKLAEKKILEKWKEFSFPFPSVCVGMSQISRMQIPIPLWTCQDIELRWMCCYSGFCLGCSATQSFRKFNLFPSPRTIVANFLFFSNSIFVLLFFNFSLFNRGQFEHFLFFFLFDCYCVGKLRVCKIGLCSNFLKECKNVSYNFGVLLQAVLNSKADWHSNNDSSLSHAALRFSDILSTSFKTSKCTNIYCKYWNFPSFLLVFWTFLLFPMH